MSHKNFEAMIWSIFLSQVFLCREYHRAQNDCLGNNFVIEGTYKNRFPYLLSEHVETQIIIALNIHLFTF